MKRANVVSFGFSMIELSIVLALFALIIILIVANVSFIHRPTVKAEVNRIYNVCRYLQRLAMVTNKRQEILFDYVHNTYTCNGTVCTLPAQIAFGIFPGVKGPPSFPKQVITHPITFKENKISFFPEGIISSGTIYITDKNKTCLYAISCSVSQVSYLRKYTYKDKWVLIS